MTNSSLLEKIEKCREEMILLSDKHDLTSDKVISSSTKLDKLILEYQKIYN
ncbi:aspartyl-phosphate phosphatase Spo0E family protein [Oceanobacillus piezotolerans]|uniref:Aspartyl-phosphate phosphatase Spo0E family protein n=1 Tax=Oceanobacillus piezotolerans TaxID=2448030 RepID=A0A498DE54_9BACI|nr:aspartyl-phosphate phosphatase Spo0E family protein [Oceanobacillus piezotolerans]RLL41365.1 aspartyl-phosphate phosphatase Spo0E family protein [Oceanobacillus piezotolerans]